MTPDCNFFANDLLNNAFCYSFITPEQQKVKVKFKKQK